ncbi:unnamed protein product, partial [marine sediment metagenome]
MYEPKHRFVYDRIKETNKGKKTGLLQIEVTYLGTKKYFSTEVHLKPNQWNGSKVIRHPESALQNTKVKKLIDKIDEYIGNTKDFSLDGLNNFVKGRSTDDFLEYFETNLYIPKKKISLARGTEYGYHVVLNKLREFDKIKTMSDLTLENIEGFKDFLIKGDISSNTLYLQISIMKKIVHQALKDKKIHEDPFWSFDMPERVPAITIYLTEDELKEIEAFDPPFERMVEARDIFLFQCYSGLSYVDVKKLTTADITVEHDMKWIVTPR